MLVKFLHCVVGGMNHNAGDVAEVDEAEAVRLFSAKIAEPVLTQRGLEKSTDPNAIPERTTQTAE
jgi:hypothetical protein